MLNHITRLLVQSAWSGIVSRNREYATILSIFVAAAVSVSAANSPQPTTARPNPFVFFACTNQNDTVARAGWIPPELFELERLTILRLYRNFGISGEAYDSSLPSV